MRSTILTLCVLASTLLFAQCESAAPAPAKASGSGNLTEAWSTVYKVLQSPRCMNCHPAGDTPLVGEASQPHPQNVQRGPLGVGLFAMRCNTCHQTQNTEGPHLPPGAPRWQLPTRGMPLVFQGKSSRELCEQLSDPRRNGGKSPEELLEHVAKDPLVLWGWAPGEGRASVPVPHAEFVRAFQTWIESGCKYPGESRTLTKPGSGAP
ncbi:MAG: hypothetical protein IPJ19_16420 [Planctomycetes bacterium]|nr:hypothetical protein [Planctomycetota bacterium]